MNMTRLGDRMCRERKQSNKQNKNRYARRETLQQQAMEGRSAHKKKAEFIIYHCNCALSRICYVLLGG